MSSSLCHNCCYESRLYFACIFQGVVGMPGPAGPRGHPGPPVCSGKHVLICAESVFICAFMHVCVAFFNFRKTSAILPPYTSG